MIQESELAQKLIEYFSGLPQDHNREVKIPHGWRGIAAALTGLEVEDTALDPWIEPIRGMVRRMATTVLPDLYGVLLVYNWVDGTLFIRVGYPFEKGVDPSLQRWLQAVLLLSLSLGRNLGNLHQVSYKNSRVNGSKWSPKDWAALDFGPAWIDPGPSPAGNPGPYLHVAGRDGAFHRVYPAPRKGKQFAPIRVDGQWFWEER